MYFMKIKRVAIYDERNVSFDSKKGWAGFYFLIQNFPQ